MTDVAYRPGYISLQGRGELRKRGEGLWEMMRDCNLCPRDCGVNRFEGETGFCKATSQLRIASYSPHFGEERPLVGAGGSGTIFFSHCNLGCVFCQNWDISHQGSGSICEIEDLAEIMLVLQDRGCHNINFVTPTHYVPHIVLAVDIAVRKGLHIPLVYNTCGWERPEILKLLEGVVDIYLPDFKYADGEVANEYSPGALTYPELTKKALLEMHRQAGVAKPGNDGLIRRGLMIRHLVLPGHSDESKEVISWIAGNLPGGTYLNLMSQYQPQFKARDYPGIARRVSMSEYAALVEWARQEGLTNLDIRT